MADTGKADGRHSGEAATEPFHDRPEVGINSSSLQRPCGKLGNTGTGEWVVLDHQQGESFFV